ncbi:MAG: 50S ribosomal protein L15 [Planctomycetes bacterium]|nr:50S ribosomal protein L15 [Planctomycetota bacterium]
MNITEVTKKAGANPRRWRVGRGEGSGSGKTSGRGHKGAGARSGCSKFELYEGGMFPFFRRIPKFGFSNVLFRKDYQVINVEDLESRFEAGAHITPAALEEAGLIGDRTQPIKVLGNGVLKKKLTVDAHRFSISASKCIESAGGKVNWLGPKPKKKFIKRRKPVEAVAPAGKKGKKVQAEAAAETETEKKEGGE